MLHTLRLQSLARIMQLAIQEHHPQLHGVKGELSQPRILYYFHHGRRTYGSLLTTHVSYYVAGREVTSHAADTTPECEIQPIEVAPVETLSEQVQPTPGRDVLDSQEDERQSYQETESLLADEDKEAGSTDPASADYKRDLWNREVQSLQKELSTIGQAFNALQPRS